MTDPTNQTAEADALGAPQVCGETSSIPKVDVALSTLPSSGSAPSEFRVFKSGINEATKGRFNFDSKAAKTVIDRYKTMGRLIAIDYDHAQLRTNSDNPAQTGKAAGSCELELRSGELWAVNVNWTPSAKQAISEREWMFISPAFQKDKDNRPQWVLNLAITNNPSLFDLTPLVEAASALFATLSSGDATPGNPAPSADAAIAVALPTSPAAIDTDTATRVAVERARRMQAARTASMWVTRSPTTQHANPNAPNHPSANMPLTGAYEDAEAVGGWLGWIEPAGQLQTPANLELDLPQESPSAPDGVGRNWIAMVHSDGRCFLWEERDPDGNPRGAPVAAWQRDLATLAAIPAQGLPEVAMRPSGLGNGTETPAVDDLTIEATPALKQDSLQKVAIDDALTDEIATAPEAHRTPPVEVLSTQRRVPGGKFSYGRALVEGDMGLAPGMSRRADVASSRAQQTGAVADHATAAVVNRDVAQEHLDVAAEHRAIAGTNGPYADEHDTEARRHEDAAQKHSNRADRHEAKVSDLCGITRLPVTGPVSSLAADTAAYLAELAAELDSESIELAYEALTATDVTSDEPLAELRAGLVCLDFNPDQPRESDGKFGSGGGGAEDHHDDDPKGKAHFEKSDAAGKAAAHAKEASGKAVSGKGSHSDAAVANKAAAKAHLAAAETSKHVGGPKVEKAHRDAAAAYKAAASSHQKLDKIDKKSDAPTKSHDQKMAEIKQKYEQKQSERAAAHTKDANKTIESTPVREKVAEKVAEKPEAHTKDANKTIESTPVHEKVAEKPEPKSEPKTEPKPEAKSEPKGDKATEKKAEPEADAKKAAASTEKSDAAVAASRHAAEAVQAAHEGKGTKDLAVKANQSAAKAHEDAAKHAATPEAASAHKAAAEAHKEVVWQHQKAIDADKKKAADSKGGGKGAGKGNAGKNAKIASKAIKAIAGVLKGIGKASARAVAGAAAVGKGIVNEGNKIASKVHRHHAFDEDDATGDLVALAAVPFASHPETDEAWDADDAIAKLRKWASSDDSGDPDTMSWTRYARGFAWVDDNDGETFASFKLPHHSVNEDDELTTPKAAVYAAAAALQGARGGINIPPRELSAVKQHIASHYHQWGGTAPWETDPSTASVERPESTERLSMHPKLAEYADKTGMDKPALKAHIAKALPPDIKDDGFAACNDDADKHPGPQIMAKVLTALKDFDASQFQKGGKGEALSNPITKVATASVIALGAALGLSTEADEAAVITAACAAVHNQAKLSALTGAPTFEVALATVERWREGADAGKTAIAKLNAIEADSKRRVALSSIDLSASEGRLTPEQVQRAVGIFEANGEVALNAYLADRPVVVPGKAGHPAGFTAATAAQVTALSAAGALPGAPAPGDKPASETVPGSAATIKLSKDQLRWCDRMGLNVTTLSATDLKDLAGLSLSAGDLAVPQDSDD